MKTKDKVASPEQCKRLFELGIIIDSEFRYYQHPSSNKWYICRKRATLGTAIEQYPAPTAIEIIDILPRTWDMYIDILCLERYTVKCWEKIKKKPGKSQLLHMLSDESLAQALTGMLIWIIDNDYLKVKELEL